MSVNIFFHKSISLVDLSNVKMWICQETGVAILSFLCLHWLLYSNLSHYRGEENDCIQSTITMISQGLNQHLIDKFENNLACHIALSDGALLSRLQSQFVSSKAILRIGTTLIMSKLLHYIPNAAYESNFGNTAWTNMSGLSILNSVLLWETLSYLAQKGYVHIHNSFTSKLLHDGWLPVMHQEGFFLARASVPDAPTPTRHLTTFWRARSGSYQISISFQYQ